MDETAATGIASPSSHHAPLPTIPFDLIPEILCRLSVKLLIQLKCVCKSWNSLISDPKFAKKHLHMSTACLDHHHLIVAYPKTPPKSFLCDKLILWDSPISSIFSNLSSTSTVPQLQLKDPETPFYDGHSSYVVSSCDGILLFDIDLHSSPLSSPSILLWNPSIRKFKFLPPFLKPSIFSHRGKAIYTFGYDHFIDNYKIFATYSISINGHINSFNQWKNEVGVYTLGYDSWRRIDDIPCDYSINAPGILVSGTVNWLVGWFVTGTMGVVSLDLEKESYRKFLMPDLNKNPLVPLGASTLGVLMNCLCIFTNSDDFLDVWIMKEYGIEGSWTKLFSVPYVGGGGPSSFATTKVLYVSEDDQVLLAFTEILDLKWKLVVYHSRNGTFKIPKIQNIGPWMAPKVYVESLISPCF